MNPLLKRTWEQMHASTVEQKSENVDTHKKQKRDIYDLEVETLQITKTVCCKARLRVTSKEEMFQNFMEQNHPIVEGAIKFLRIADFANNLIITSFQDPCSKEFVVPEVEISAYDESSKCCLAFLKGLLIRKDEVAVVPLPNSSYQLLLFEKEEIQDSYSILNPIVYAIVTEKFKFVLDLDETLVRTRMHDEPATIVNSFRDKEYPICVQNQKLIVSVRPGVDLILNWACKLFKVYIFTNGIFEYAKEVLRVLDEKGEHLLQGVNLSDDVKLKQFLKTREDMSSKDPNSKIGQKELQKHNLSVFESVIFDDDDSVWKKNKDNLLPFDDIVIASKNMPQEIFYRVRTEVWSKLKLLQRLKSKLKLRQVQSKPLNDKIVFSQQITYSQEFLLNEK